MLRTCDADYPLLVSAAVFGHCERSGAVAGGGHWANGSMPALACVFIGKDNGTAAYNKRLTEHLYRKL